MEALVRGACGDLDRDRGEADLAFIHGAFPDHLIHAAHRLGGRNGECGDGGRAIEANIYQRDAGRRGGMANAA
eukprot:4035000-Prymnesium_polylepis.1